MVLLDISIQYRVVIGISAMVLLFSGFLVAIVLNHRKKLQYHKKLQAINEERQQLLKEQNMVLEQRVRERTAELSQQKEALQKAFQELKASQSQLIQKEKMASLGELTAGVAHEIQNPLNFVLNFGEINLELLAEIKQHMKETGATSGMADEIISIMNDVEDNSQKILHHSRRADGIVKNMLQHARTKAGVEEWTDLNDLTDEYLKLAYHGFRAKHKSFHCNFSTTYDNQVGRLNLVAHDVGHTLVNLFNNAFFSMMEKTKQHPPNYEPLLTVTTEKKGNKALICITDNGQGVSPRIIDKVFQPFFTTKPTGEATGLGLSLSYDMIKAHQGELRAESVEGEFATFTIELNY